MKLSRDQFRNSNATLAALGCVHKFHYGPIICEGKVTIWTLTAELARCFKVSHLRLSTQPVDPTTRPTKVDWIRCRGTHNKPSA